MTATIERPAYLTLTGHKEKDRAPYKVNLGDRHRGVLTYLKRWEMVGATDSEITFALHLHQAGARRCELRDVGAVRRGGRRKGSWVWKITARGKELLEQLDDIHANKGDTTSEEQQ